ncbi:MAG: ATP-binding protein, partial [Planctomycetaceae bacterium]|nr:ATP-binding protein [Planctomycetaceae bacterium]
VALRQLAVMERYLKQFFSRSDSRAKQLVVVDLVQLVNQVLQLVHPHADHVGVRTEFISPEHSVLVKGDADGLEQLITNLLQNGIEASAIPRTTGDSFDQVGNIIIQIKPSTSDHVKLIIKDSGPGPSSEVKNAMFEPLVTGRTDGTGLGLSVAQEIAMQHNSKICWERCDEMTCFTLELPILNGEEIRV